MFNFGGITHIIKNPAGSYSYVGSVPGELLGWRKPTIQDAIAGRTHNGMAWYNVPRPTIEDAVRDAKNVPHVHLCDSPTCACRQLF